MKKIDGVLAIAAALLVTVGTTGCQSGWKFSTPFSRAPKASHAEAPDELDDDFAEVDDITPPPENYTVGDSTSKKEKTSLAQKGKYGSESDDSAIALEKTTRDSSDETENYQTPSYAQNYQTPGKTVTNEIAGSATQTYARQSVPENLADTVSSLNPNAVAAASQPYTPPSSASTQLYSSNDRQIATNAQPAAQTAASEAFPTASNTLFNNNPIAQVSGSTTQVPAQAQEQPASVAFNYDPSAPSANSPAPTPASDQYSDVIYTPQTTSGGFAPGSVLY